MAPHLSPRRGPDAISPTAHYTGHAWVRNDLSHPELATWQGRMLFGALRPPMELSRLLGGPTLEGALLARHRLIDGLLERAIEAGNVRQVIEPACGMSPRGWRFSERYGERVTYIEGDLPEMAERKRRALARMSSLNDLHRVVDLDVLRESGPRSLRSLIDTLDHGEGLAIITEGLLTYLDREQALASLRRFAEALGDFRHGLYLSDLRLAGLNRGPAERAFGVVLSVFVRGRVHTHFVDEAEATAALKAVGFSQVRLHRGDIQPLESVNRRDPGAGLIHVIEGTVG
jgi:O-methyltransferase involved in polyketide biosynthesis